jgi:hypothetical protein
VFSRIRTHPSSVIPSEVEGPCVCLPTSYTHCPESRPWALLSDAFDLRFLACTYHNSVIHQSFGPTTTLSSRAKLIMSLRTDQRSRGTLCLFCCPHPPPSLSSRAPRDLSERKITRSRDLQFPSWELREPRDREKIDFLHQRCINIGGTRRHIGY